MKKDIKKIVFIIAFVWFISIWFFAYLNRDKIPFWGKKTVSGEEWEKTWSNYNSKYIDKIIEDLKKTNVYTKKDFLKNYCKVILDNWSFTEATDGIEYNPAKSTFVYAICSPFKDDIWAKFDSSLEAILKSESEIKNNVKQLMSDDCDPYSTDKDADMNNCNFSQFLSKLYAKVMNDYSNIKLAAVYWLTETDISESIDKFNKQNFWEKACGWSGKYISESESDSDENWYCSHPKTYKLLSDYLKKLKKLVENSTYIDWDKALDQKCDDGWWDFIKCAFESDTKSIAAKEFKNLLLNDLMYYNMLLGYYNFMITYEWALMGFSNPEFVWTDFESNRIEEMLVKKEISLAQKSTVNMIRLIIWVKNTLPTHIALMAYYEDVVNFRNQLVKYYTTVKTLSGKTSEYKATRK